jgi:hypothetical protein
MRNCFDEGTLQSWFDGELDANAAANVTAHLHPCAACAEAATTLEAENLMLAESLSAEFAAAIPTERLRQRVDAAVAGLQVASMAPVKRSWWSRLGDLLPSFRVLLMHPQLQPSCLPLVRGGLSETAAANSFSGDPGGLPDIALLTPKVDQVGNASGSNQSDSLPSREIKPIRKTRPVEEQANSLPAGTAIERAIAKLNEALSAQAPLRPRCGSNTNTTWQSSTTPSRPPETWREEPQSIQQATQFMLAAYQSKIDLMNQVADARLLER